MATEVMYLGRPGALVEIHQPRGGVRSTRYRPTSVFETAAGFSRVAKMVDGCRKYELSYQGLTFADYATLEGFAQGHQGPGPFVFIEPGRRNFLTANQSGATSVRNDTDGFTVGSSAQSLSSDSSLFRRGPRALDWNFATTATGTLTLSPPTCGWPGIPVASRSHVFSFYARRKPGAASAQVQAVLKWLDVSGATLETTNGNYTVTTSAAWTRVSIADSPPASTAFVNCMANGSGHASGTYFAMDEFLFEEGTVAGDWSPGTSLMPVAIENLDESYSWVSSTFRSAPILVLKEVQH